MRNYYFLFFLPIVVCGCHKYNKLTPDKGAAYLRVFNDISTTPNLLNNGNLNTFVTFLMDPVMDGSGAPVNGSVVGDYLTTRQKYTISYPSNAASTIAGSGTVNYEYPGRARVLTAPPMNGFDMSSWAQIPAGTHRILFVSRPTNETPFDSLTTAQRSRTLVDTTIDFQQGQVYTIEAILKNVDANTYDAYVRNEQFVHQQFSPDSLYIGFYNLSATIDTSDINVYSEYYNWFSSDIKISGTYYKYNYTFLNFDTVQGYTNASVSIDRLASTGDNYMVFPLLDSSAFFTPTDSIGTYGRYVYDYFSARSIPTKYSGTLPFVFFQINQLYSGPYFLLCWASPVNYNNLYQGFDVNFSILPNLNLITGVGGNSYVYPTLNFLELVNNGIYMTQIQKGFNQLP